MSVKITINKDRIDDVEEGIAPPMSHAITLPVTMPGIEGMCIYVAASPFSSARYEGIHVRAALLEVASRLVIKPGA